MDNIVVFKPREIFPIRTLVSHDNNFSEYRNDLISWMEEYIKNNKSVYKSNFGGYQSPDNFLYKENSDDILDDFKPYYYRIQNQIEKMTKIYFEDCDITDISFSNAWFNFNYKNCYNNIHVHPKSTVSGVLWVQTIKEHPPITFHDPNEFNQSDIGFKTFESFYPTDGDMMLFPSFLQHGINANTTDTTRISIAFNLLSTVASHSHD